MIFKYYTTFISNKRINLFIYLGGGRGGCSLNYRNRNDAKVTSKLVFFLQITKWKKCKKKIERTPQLFITNPKLSIRVRFMGGLDSEVCQLEVLSCDCF